MPEGPRPPSPKGPGSIRHHSGSPPDGAWSRPAMCGADAEGQSVTGSPAPRSSGTGRAASGPGPADPGGEGSSALCDAPLRDASFRSIPRRARGTPRGSAAPAAASAGGRQRHRPVARLGRRGDEFTGCAEPAEDAPDHGRGVRTVGAALPVDLAPERRDESHPGARGQLLLLRQVTDPAEIVEDKLVALDAHAMVLPSPALPRR